MFLTSVYTVEEDIWCRFQKKGGNLSRTPAKNQAITASGNNRKSVVPVGGGGRLERPSTCSCWMYWRACATKSSSSIPRWRR